MTAHNYRATSAPQKLPSSLWAATASPFSAHALDAAIDVDVLVVGGGYTGLSCALHLREREQSVALLEGSAIGFGGSGRNVGLVNAGLWTPPDEINRAIGDEFGNRLYSQLSAAPKKVFALIQAHGIECEAQRNGTLQLARSKRGVAELEARFAQLQARGEPVTWLDQAATAQSLGTDFYRRAIHDARAGTIQPLGYARGLAKACVARGVQLFEGSPVTELSRTGDSWLARTPQGQVKAQRVVMATNAYSGSLLPQMQQSFTPVHYFQLASEPLPESLRADILPGKEGCWDTGLVMTSLRIDQAGRLILGSVGKIADGASSALLERWGQRTVAKIFPKLSRVNWQYTWSGQIAYSDDHLPHLHELAPGLVTVMGYSGRGIGPGTVMGDWLARYVTEADLSQLPLPVSAPQAISLRQVQQHYYRFGSDLYHCVHPR
ncbi:MAG: NAD(P)/FAD-dependent oxidoreductase [Pseudomonadales bacterium]